MSKLDDKIALYTKAVSDLGLNIPSDFLTKVTKGLGPSIYKKDSEIIACTKENELKVVKENFLQKKLGLTESDDDLMRAIKAVCDEMGSSNTHKYRAIFYALLAQKFNKQALYDA